MFKIEIAGLTVQINNRCDYVRRECEAYITESDSADFTVEVSQEEILARQKELGAPVSESYCEFLTVYRNIVLQLPLYGAVLIHAAAVAVDGEAFLFLAKSGVGKTTQARLWLEAFGDRAQIINGDKPVVRKIGGRWHVCGTPWQGKENFGLNTSVPLKALCFLERGAENSIAPASLQETSKRIFHQLLLPESENCMNALFDLLEELLGEIPAYVLQCNKDENAAEAFYGALKNSLY